VSPCLGFCSDVLERGVGGCVGKVCFMAFRRVLKIAFVNIVWGSFSGCSRHAVWVWYLSIVFRCAPFLVQFA
jgi:hypothetical protein